MPSSATITAFYNFVATTKARSSQVNTNFEAIRGHYIPVDPNTLTAGVTNTWDLGASDHRWRTGYFGSVDLLSSSTTAAVTLSADTSLTTGAFLVKVNAVEKFRVDTLGPYSTQGYQCTYLTTTAIPVMTGDAALTVGAFVFKVGGVEKARIGPDGVFPRNQLSQINYAEGSITGSVSSTATPGSVDIPGTTLTVISVLGRPVLVALQNTATTTSQAYGDTPGGIQTFTLVRNGSVISKMKVSRAFNSIPWYIDTGIAGTPGTYVYNWRLDDNQIGGNIGVTAMKNVAVEL